MNNIGLIINDENLRQISEELAERLSIAIISSDQALSYDFWLFYEAGMLKILNHSSKKIGAVWVDFSRGKAAYRQKHHGKGKLPISRACGIKQSHRPKIIDATTGLGQDAFVLAGLGCEVVCVEQQPIVAALLEDGLSRARRGEPWLQAIVHRMHLITAKAESALESEAADIVYLDPMFPHEQNKKQAKVNKGMQLFRVFPGTCSNDKSLLESALAAASDRVVVKRPDWASPLDDRQPTYQVPSKNHRFDVYKTGKDSES